MFKNSLNLLGSCLNEFSKVMPYVLYTLCDVRLEDNINNMYIYNRIYRYVKTGKIGKALKPIYFISSSRINIK